MQNRRKLTCSKSLRSNEYEQGQIEAERMGFDSIENRNHWVKHVFQRKANAHRRITSSGWFSSLPVVPGHKGAEPGQYRDKSCRQKSRSFGTPLAPLRWPRLGIWTPTVAGQAGANQARRGGRIFSRPFARNRVAEFVCSALRGSVVRIRTKKALRIKRRSTDRSSMRIWTCPTIW